MKLQLCLATLILAASFFNGSAFCRAKLLLGAQFISHGQKPAQQSRIRKFRLGLVGYIALPEDYKVYRVETRVDAWWGYILSPGNGFRVDYSAGMYSGPGNLALPHF